MYVCILFISNYYLDLNFRQKNLINGGNIELKEEEMFNKSCQRVFDSASPKILIFI